MVKIDVCLGVQAACYGFGYDVWDRKSWVLLYEG